MTKVQLNNNAQPAEGKDLSNYDEMIEENPILSNLFDEISAKAEPLKHKNIALYFVMVNQAIGVMRAAEALGTPIKERTECEP